MKKQNHSLSNDTVAVGLCSNCKFAKPDVDFAQILLCDNPKLKISAVFTTEGCQFAVDPDFGCVQFEKRRDTTK